MRRVPCGHFRPRRYEQFLHRTRGATLEIAYLAEFLVLIQRHRKYADVLELCGTIVARQHIFDAFELASKCSPDRRSPVSPPAFGAGTARSDVAEVAARRSAHVA